MDLDPTRLRVMKLIQQRRTDLKKASLAIGRNAAYLQQYLYRGIPKTLPEDAREALAAFLGVPEESLRPDAWILSGAGIGRPCFSRARRLSRG
jgi:hypothetical protein